MSGATLADWLASGSTVGDGVAGWPQAASAMLDAAARAATRRRTAGPRSASVMP
jgi:hypothetical protein